MRAPQILTSVTMAIVILAAADAFAAVTPSQSCLAAGAWHMLGPAKPQKASPHAVLSEMAARDVVLLGEEHGNADHHRWQLQTLAVLHALRPHMIIGFEAFPRRVQPVLDRWIGGALSAQEFLEQVEWRKVWNFPPELYLPLFEFARLNRIPMLALNVERSLTAAIRERGWDAVPDEHREGLSRPAPAAAGYVDHLHEIHARHAAHRQGSEAASAGSAFRYFVEAQTTWDRAFAQSLAQPLQDAAATRPLAVGIMGSGHVRHGYGVTHQLRELGITRVGALLPVAATAGCGELGAGLADAVFAIPAPATSNSR